MPDCKWWQIGCHVQSASEATAGFVWDNTIGKFIRMATDSFGDAVAQLGSFWTRVPTVGTFGGTETINWVHDSTAWLLGILVTLSVIIAGIKLILDRRSESALDLVKSLLLTVIVGGVSISGVMSFSHVADLFSSWIVERSTTDGNWTKYLFPADLLTPAVWVSNGVVTFLLLGVLGILLSVIQIGLMLVRSAMLILLAGVLPLIPALYNTTWGKEWFEKTMAWLIAFLLYKPAAAIIYATGVKMLGQDAVFDSSQVLLRYVLGTIILGMGVFALPALIKLIMPATASLSKNSGGGLGMMFGMGAMASTQMIGGSPSGARAESSGGSGGVSTPTGQTQTAYLKSQDGSSPGLESKGGPTSSGVGGVGGVGGKAGAGSGGATPVGDPAVMAITQAIKTASGVIEKSREEIDAEVETPEGASPSDERPTGA